MDPEACVERTSWGWDCQGWLCCVLDCADHVAARDTALDGREAALAPLERAMEAGRVAARDATACMATLERTIRRLLDPAAVVAALAGVGVCGGRGTVAAAAA